jgi:epsilon-lactone hydrolase
MRKTKAIWIAKGLCLLLLPLVVSAHDEGSVLRVPAKEISVPTTVSPEMAKVIVSPVPPNTQMPTNADGWRKLQLERDTAAREGVRAAAKLLGVEVEATKIAGVSCFRVTPKEVAAGNKDRLIVHVHGGAYVFNAGLAGTGEAVLLADVFRGPVLSVDYRMPPDHPFPAAPDDVLAVWKAVLADRDPQKIAMAGTSAGAGLIMTTMLRVKELALPMPAALFLGTPGADVSRTGDSLYVNAEIDHQLGRYEGRMEESIRLYAGGRDLKDPLLSPIYGNLSGFPPTILISGTRDLMPSATTRTHRKLRAAGVTAELHIYEGQSHADYLVGFPAPESRDALHEIALFFDGNLKR